MPPAPGLMGMGDPWIWDSRHWYLGEAGEETSLPGSPRGWEHG